MDKFKSETELAKLAIEYLKDSKWEVYQEVQVRSFGSIADIVAVQNNLIWIVECKLSLSLDVIAQAKCWSSFSHYISIAVPRSNRDNKGRRLAFKILQDYGIGCFEFGHPEDISYSCYAQKIKPQLNRKAMTDYITSNLCEEQKTWAEAGNSRGDRYTPFQNTTRQIVRTVNDNPGITMKELMDKIDHHYSSDICAKSSIIQWIHKDVIKGIYLEKEGKQYKLYPIKKRGKN